MPRRDSKPELALRSELHRRGLRYRVHLRGLPGTPDIAFTRAKLAVFVDGCFWHGCPIHYVAPKNNGAWWEAKMVENSERDDRVDESLKDMGWLPIHIWEHDDPVEAADAIQRIWRRRPA
jgi:DNA mismatch endonuclease (patch repair protein)